MSLSWCYFCCWTLLSTADPSQPDIIEEALDLFRANCLFRNFEIKGECSGASLSRSRSKTKRRRASQPVVAKPRTIFPSAQVILTPGPADRLLIYLILFISECLTKLAPSPSRPSPGYQEATKVLSTLSVDTFALPGDAGFPLNSLYHAPGSRVDAGESNWLHLCISYLVASTAQYSTVKALRTSFSPDKLAACFELDFDDCASQLKSRQAIHTDNRCTPLIPHPNPPGARPPTSRPAIPP